MADRRLSPAAGRFGGRGAALGTARPLAAGDRNPVRPHAPQYDHGSAIAVRRLLADRDRLADRLSAAGSGAAGGLDGWRRGCNRKLDARPRPGGPPWADLTPAGVPRRPGRPPPGLPRETVRPQRDPVSTWVGGVSWTKSFDSR